MSTQPVQRIYFNPNWNPEFYYPLIKPLLVLYEQVVLWCPVHERLQKWGWKEGDFRAALTGPAPAIIPAGRTTWFDAHHRRDHYDESCRHYDPAFERAVEKAALKSMSIPGPALLETGYAIVEELWQDPRRRQLIEQSMELPERVTLKGQRDGIAAVAEGQGKSTEWAILNAYVQDILAMNSVRANAPLVFPDYLGGYRLVADQGLFDPLVEPRLIGRGMDHPSPGLPAQVTPERLRRFMEDAFHATEMSWTELSELRLKWGPSVRAWLETALPPMDPAAPLDSISKAALAEAVELRKLAGSLGPSAAVGVSGALAMAGAPFWGLVIGATSAVALFRHRSTLPKALSRALGGPNTRFLADTPFFNAKKGE